MNRRNRTPTNVNGIQKTPNSRSEMAKLSKNIFVTERIERSNVSVIITSKLPTIDNINMIEYGNINVSIVSNVNMATNDNDDDDSDDDDSVVAKDSVLVAVDEE